MDKINQYLTYGVPDYLAIKLQALEISVSDAKKLPQKTLMKQFFLTKEEVSLLKRFITRIPIRENVAFKLLENSNFTCCVCKGEKGSSYIIHHINQYWISQGNSYENLAILCPNDHDRAHMKGFSLTKALSASEIKKAKKNWEKIVFENKNQEARKPKTKAQWNNLASKAATYLGEHIHEAHRGVLPWNESITAIFGNDGYDSEEGQHEVFLLRKALTKKNIREVAFGVCKEKYSWCLFVDSNNLEELDTILWTCWPEGSSNNPYQHTISSIAVSSYLTSPLYQILQ